MWPDVGAALTTFAIILLAELPDKTALATLVLGTRFRPAPVLTGAAVAFALQVVLACVAGSLLTLLPHNTLEIIVTVLFVAGALFLFFSKPEPESEDDAKAKQESQRFWVGAVTTFGVLAVAEFGDLTQILTANLVARYHNPFPVGIASWAAMWSISVAAVLGGRNLLKLIPVRVVTRAAAGLMVVLAGFTLASVLT